MDAWLEFLIQLGCVLAWLLVAGIVAVIVFVVFAKAIDRLDKDE